MNISFTRAQINEICEEIIDTFMNGESLDNPVSIGALACRFFKLTVCFVRFADEDAKPCGYTCDGHTGVDVVLHNKRVRHLFQKNTILLDERLKKDEVALREVLAHELTHYIDSIVNAYPAEILIMSNGMLNMEKYLEFLEDRERRADIGAAALLLPKALVTNVYRDRIGYENIKVYGDSYFMTEDKIKIVEIAKFLKVSYEMLIERLNDLDLLEKHKLSELVMLKFGNEGRAV